MNRQLKLLVLATPLFLAACATPPTDQNTTVDAASLDGLRCERTATTGSRLGREVCTTREQREQMAAEAREDVERMQKAGARGATKSN